MLGFRWGRHGFDMEAYRRYSADPSLPTAYAPGAPVSLSDLFGGETKFTCVIYMQDANGHRPALVRTESNQQLSPSAMQAEFQEVGGEDDDSVEQQGGTDVIGRTMKKRSMGGDSVCWQRCTMKDFFQPATDQLWFCYSATSQDHACEEADRRDFYQAVAFTGATVAVLITLAWLMQGQGHFALPVSMVVRVFLNLELGLLVTAAQLLMDVDASEANNRFLSIIMVVAISAVLMAPYNLCCQVDEGKPDLFGMFYLLMLAFSPCACVSWMCYYPRLPLLLEHKPMIVGGLGVLVEILKCLLCGLALPDAKQYRKQFNYTPMMESEAGGTTLRDSVG